MDRRYRTQFVCEMHKQQRVTAEHAVSMTHSKAYDKCRAALARLALLDHELRRPEGDYLRDGIYELRVRSGSVNYRLLYSFHGRTVSVVAHGLTKEAAVPAADIN